MLHLTLYKDCILNDNYQNVFSLGIRRGQTKNVLERYLETLESYHFELNNVYYENNGEFVLEFDNQFNPYLYNYIKVIDDEINLLRYCFIESIQIKNGAVYINYKEDIWSSYFKAIKGILPSYLENTRVKEYSNFKPKLLELPYDYTGNNSIELVDVITNKIDIDFNVVVELQKYDLVQYYEGKAVRDVKYIVIGRYHSTPGYTYWSLNIEECEDIIRDLMKNMATHTIDGLHYEIGDIYFVPMDFELTNASGLIYSQEQDFGVDDIHFRYIYPSAASIRGLTLITKTVENNYKNLSIGNFDNQIDIINNGTDFDFKILFFYTNGSLSFKLSALNQIIDITKSYKYEVPFTSLLSSEYAQRAMSEQLKVFNLDTQSEQKQISGIVGFGQTAFDFLGMFGANTFGSISKALGELVNSVFSVKGVGGGYQSQIDAEKWTISAPKYSNSKGVFGNYTSIANLGYGLFIIRIKSENDDFVKKMIDNNGFKTYEFIYNFNDLDLDNVDYFRDNEISYNVIKFSTVNVYGSFPKEVAEQMNSILKSNIKIWYSKDMQEDNYEI